MGSRQISRNVSISRCARIVACAAARSVGSGSEGVVTNAISPDSRQKIALQQFN
jgi:hypothetical protein